MRRADLLLKIITAANGENVTPIQLQKVAFLIGQEFARQLPKDYYKFHKYDYGPFSTDVYHDAKELESEGKITITINPRGGWREYAATVRGMMTKAEEIPIEMSDFIAKKVCWARSLTFQQLVRAVYREFPEYRENSVFQG